MARNTNLIEEIDELKLDSSEIKNIFSQLNLINRLSGNNRLIRKAFDNILNKEVKERIHIVDLGCGDGSHIIMLKKHFQKRNIDAHFTGIDFNNDLLETAIFNSADSNLIQFVQADILHPDFELPQCDILLTSQFLYHLTDEQVLTMLSRNRSKIHSAIIISELRRSDISKLLLKFIGLILKMNPLIIEDGSKAIDRSWKKSELVALLKQNKPLLKIRTIGGLYRMVLTCF